ncbi:serine hydrolase domain-containing protein [Yoonia sp. R2331]|uniref:serine hydrolase domain-containing protein n=1 Tax=Yoonia sp. R2331 TaxID=3237238 RepID=UPI0034E482B8
MRPELDQLARSLAGPFAFCGIAVSQGGDDSFHVATAPNIPGKDTSLMRVASVSKIVTGLAFVETLRRADLPHGMDTDASDVLGWPLRNPHHPDQPITLAMLASHASSLSDKAGYAISAKTDLRTWVASHDADIFDAGRPGSGFDYSNLGYILLAACVEKLGQARFDLRARAYVLAPLSILGGFNWSGVSSAHRIRAIPTYRRGADGFAPMIDGHVAASGVLDSEGQPHHLGGYALGSNPALFSPQGGLRMSLRGMLRLARALKTAELPVLWSPEMGQMDDPHHLFDRYGPGVQMLRTPAFYPRALVGHFGSAYGFKGGVWYDAEADLAFAYALNGVAMDDESDALGPAEKQILTAIAALKG